ncbi:MAG: YceI family protein [Xanthomonadaceae bacterium]|nr:YceI family protein [Xanthomonadaceae bacterium]
MPRHAARRVGGTASGRCAGTGACPAGCLLVAVRRPLASLLLAGLALAAPTARSSDYRIDTRRSHAEFAIRLLWLHTIKGRFTQITGDVKLDPHGLATVDASIATDSIVTDSRWVRRWILAPEFFDAARYPALHFRSAPVTLATLTAGGTLNGRLRLRGIVRPVRFELLPARCPTLAAASCLIEARGHISRSAFGMRSHRATLSDRVQLGLLIALDPTLD